jgi:hypothetical protein
MVILLESQAVNKGLHILVRAQLNSYLLMTHHNNKNIMNNKKYSII